MHTISWTVKRLYVLFYTFTVHLIVHVVIRKPHIRTIWIAKNTFNIKIMVCIYISCKPKENEINGSPNTRWATVEYDAIKHILVLSILSPTSIRSGRICSWSLSTFSVVHNPSHLKEWWMLHIYKHILRYIWDSNITTSNNFQTDYPQYKVRSF